MKLNGIINGTQIDHDSGANIFGSGIQEVESGRLASRDERIMDIITFGVPGVIAGFADTVLNSIGLVEQDSVENMLRKNVPAFGDFYGREKVPLQTLGDLSGIYLGGMVALKAYRGAGILARAINGGRKNALLDSVFLRSGRFERTMQAIRNRDVHLAKRGVQEVNTEAKRTLLAQRAKLNKVSDVIKENLAFEAGVFTFLNDSQTLYPDEFTTSELIALNAAFPALFAGGSLLRIGRSLRASARDVAEISHQVRNPAGFDEPISRGATDITAGSRDTVVTIHSRNRTELEDVVASEVEREATTRIGGKPVSFERKKTELKSEITVLDGQIVAEVKKLGTDTPFGWNQRIDLPQSYINTARNALRNDEFTFVATESIEPLVAKRSEQLKIIAKRKELITKAEGEVRVLNAEILAKADDPAEDITDLLKQAADKQAKLLRLQSSQLQVLSPDGKIYDLASYKPTSRDVDLDIKSVKNVDAGIKGWEVRPASDTIYDAPGVLIGITDDFQLIIPKVDPKTVKLSNVNVTKVLKRNELSAPENFKNILRDIGEDWHLFREGKAAKNRGQEIFATLSPAIKDALEKWKGSRTSSPIGKWFEDGTEEAAELFAAFEPQRQRLREIADADGTIPLLRGENIAETLKPTNDVVSMTSDPAIALKFAEEVRGKDPNVIGRRVHPDDVIVVIGGLGQEFEYIVKGNLNRVAIPTEVGSRFEALTLEHRTAAFAGLQKAIEKWTPATGKQIVISPDDHYTRLDSVLELIAEHGQAALDKITLPKGINSAEDLLFTSLSRKYEDIVRMLEMTEAKHGKLLKLSDEQTLIHTDMVRMTNLPGTNNGELPPLFELFLNLHVAQGETSLKEAVGSLDNLKRMVQEVETLPEMLPFKRDGVSLMGNQLSFPEDSLPLLLTKRSASDEQYSRAFLTEAVTIERARVFQMLSTASAKGGLLVQNITQHFIDNPKMFQTAKGVDTLTEGQMRGSQGVSQLSFAMGENPAMAALNAGKLGSTKAHRVATEQIFAANHAVLNFLKAPANEGHLTGAVLFIHASRQGWDVLPEAVIVKEGSDLTGFALDPASSRNQERFKKMFGRQFEEGELMPVPGTDLDGAFLRYTPLALTEPALAAANAFNSLSEIVLANKNVLREATGRGAMRQRQMHVAPKNFANKDLVFILSDAGEVISTVPGRTIAEANEKARVEIQRRGGGASIVDPADVERYFDLENSVFHGMRNFEDPIFQTGPLTGKQVGLIPDVGEAALNDVIKSYQRQFDSILRQTREIIFEPEMQFARKRLAAVKPKAGKTGLSIWQQYMGIVTDRPSINQHQLIGMSNLNVEKIYDSILSVSADRYAAFFNPPGLQKARAGRREDKIYRVLEDQLGEFNPFQSGLDFAQKTFKLAPPRSMKKDMAVLTSFTSFIALRMFEVGHFVLTMTSLAATMPAVISFMRITPDELARGAKGREEFHARIGSFGNVVDTENAMFSPVRAITTTIHDWFTDAAFRAELRVAGKQGYYDQSVSESIHTLTAPAEGYHAGIVRRAQDTVSILSDKGERWARAWSFAVGYNIARRSGITTQATRNTMANDFANKVIGDFSSTNRPRIFQGATGMPIGLFQTFMWNYFQRMFSYIENGSNRALAIQVATQAAVFGGNTIPGYQQFSETFLTNYDGSVNPIDSLNRKFGTSATEAIMMGGVSNIPKLFGFEDGLNFSSRGDVNPRNFPSLLTLGDTPVFQMFQNFFDLSTETFGMLRTRGGFDGDQMSDIIQAYSTNRFLRSMASLYTGHVIDRRGQPISTDSPSFMDIFRGDIQNEIALVARLSGVKTLTESNRAAAGRRNRATDISQRQRLGELRDVLRSDARSGKLTQESMETAFEIYHRFGGSKNYFPRFMIEQFMRAKVDKTSLDIMTLMNNPQKMNNLLRLMDAL